MDTEMENLRISEIHDTGQVVNGSKDMEEAREPEIQPVKILAWDYSGSTSNMKFYHETGYGYILKFAENTEGTTTTTTDAENEPIYLRWDTCCEKIDYATLKSICENRDGCGGTDPSTVISWIQRNIPKEKPIELWLVTDGEIGTSELQKCTRLNKAVNYASINFIVINQSKINMSVGASFFGGTHLKIYENETLLKEIFTSKPFNYSAINLDNFENTWESLTDFIQAKFMGSDLDGLDEVEKLNALRTRLLKAVDAQDSHSNKPNEKYPVFASRKKSDLVATLKSCKFYRTLTNSNVKTQRMKIDAGISTLINYIHNKHKSLVFEQIKFDHKQGGMADVLYEAEPELENLDNYETCAFYDAVTLDDEKTVPVLLLEVTDLVSKYWVNGSYSKFRNIMDCPLVGKLDDCIGHVYTYETFKSLLYNNDSEYIVNPMTNNRVFGGLIFTTDADAWNDYVITKTFFRGKKVKTCLALWYYVIWEHAQKKAWLEPSVVEIIKSYAFRRLAEGKVRLAFSSLPLSPQEIVPVHVACYYCTEGSTLLFGENKELFPHEMARMYWSATESMLDILNHFGYKEIDKKAVRKRATVFQLVAYLKRIPQLHLKRKFLLDRAFESKESFLTYVIKNPDELKYLSLLKYHHKISMIPFNFESGSNAVDFRTLVYMSYDWNYEAESENQICHETMRPFFVVKYGKNKLISNYEQILACCLSVELGPKGEILKKIPAKKLRQNAVMSMNKMYIDLTAQLGKFPTLANLTDYVAKVKSFCGEKVRLFPPEILNNIQYTFEEYAVLDVKVDEFIKKSSGSIRIVDRIEMEKRFTVKNVDEFVNNAKERWLVQIKE